MKVRKLAVAPGLFWVEVPEVGLNILCGCPADAVKHLMRRGLIMPTEVAGVPCETGPNAILLSDVMLQGGNFCNLAEFPVLQMFYRQGMILPGHPNNTGMKPVLIGSREQVDAQMQYIYRGNYGLVTEEEMLEAGASPDVAHELMRMKLRFAFGRIRHPRDLLDACYVEDGWIELRDGVTIRRRSMNVFEIAYGGESVVVDLTLPAGQSYGPPYPLNKHRVRRDYFAVIHSGDGDGWDINRPSMGSVLIYQGRVFLIDAGPNVEYSLMALGIGVNEIEGLFHTHCHDDHFAGLTTLLRSDKRIKYYATPLVRASVTRKLSALLSIDENSVRDYFDTRDLPAGGWTDIEGLEVMPVISPHPVETSVFLFRTMWAEGWRTYAHFADIVSLKVLEGMIEEDLAKPGICRATYDRVVNAYALPADIKKLDVGGGLIHGAAEDFDEDASGKIILAHTSRALSDAEKEIGSGAPFGTVEVLVPGEQDFVWRNAYDFLTAYFPAAPQHALRVLLNNPKVTVNPETIIIREGVPARHIYLVLTGNVEMIRSKINLSGLLSAGALLGEASALWGHPVTETYRAATFVQALQIPSRLYRAFVERNALGDEILVAAQRRAFLRSTWLFGEAVSDVTLTRLAREMPLMSFSDGEVIDTRRRVGLIRSGTVHRLLSGHVTDKLKPGDVFGEELAVFDAPPITRTVAAGPVEVYLISGELLRDIPVARWKLFEAYRTRVHGFLSDPGTADRFSVRWRDEYSVNIQLFDSHHRTLFERANSVFHAVAEGRGRDEILETVRFLVEYSRYHFAREEELMARYGYPETAEHQARHQRLIAQVQDLQHHFQTAANTMNGEEVAQVLRDWITGHILVEDRKYAAYLNARGVY